MTLDFKAFLHVEGHFYIASGSFMNIYSFISHFQPMCSCRDQPKGRKVYNMDIPVRRVCFHRNTGGLFSARAHFFSKSEKREIRVFAPVCQQTQRFHLCRHREHKAVLQRSWRNSRLCEATHTHTHNSTKRCSLSTYSCMCAPCGCCCL